MTRRILILQREYYKIQKYDMEKNDHWILKDLSHLLKQLNLKQEINGIAENAVKLAIIKRIARYVYNLFLVYDSYFLILKFSFG